MCLWPGLLVLKAVAGDRIVGVVAGDPRRRHGYTIIATLGVDPAMRGRGIGERLLRACESQFDLPLIRLQVRMSNAPAIGLYKKLDYAIIDTLPRYYGDGEDAYLMEKWRG
jgi:ribosomal-protein-alanine N-acetyltransferase